MFGFNRAPRSQRHPDESDLHYAARLATGLGRPDVVVDLGMAAPIMPSELAVCLIALKRNISAEAAEEVFNQSALAQAIKSSPER